MQLSEGDRVGVIGANGSFGRLFTEKLAEEQVTVLAFVRNPEAYQPPPSVPASQIEVFPLSDVTRGDELRKGIRGAAAVINTVTDFNQAREGTSACRDIYNTNVGGAITTLREAEFAEVPTVVYMSSEAVYGVPKHEGDVIYGTITSKRKKHLRKNKTTSY